MFGKVFSIVELFISPCYAQHASLHVWLFCQHPRILGDNEETLTGLVNATNILILLLPFSGFNCLSL